MAVKIETEPDPAEDKAAAFLLLRLFYGIFWLLQGFGKAYDQESGILAWRNLDIWSWNTTQWFAKQTVLSAWLVLPYLFVLPYAELALGLSLLLGMHTRRALLFSAALLITLQAGLLLQLKHDTVALNMIHLLAVLWALHWSRHERWTIGEYLRGLPRSGK